MEGVAQANQGIGTQFVGEQAGHAPAHRLAADGKRPCDLLAHPGIHPTPLFQQFGLLIGGAFLAVEAAGGHVVELEAHYRNPACGQQLRHPGHEFAVHRRTGAVGEYQRGLRRRCRPIPQPLIPRLRLRALIPVNTGTLPFAHACLALEVLRLA
ncbi:hypothetical protein D9M68_884680 [compost metagenome]